MNEDIYDFAEDNNLDEMVVLIESGSDLSKRNEFGWTPLHLAISNEHEAMASLLLEHEADPSVQDNNGETALHYAARNEMCNIAEIILAKKPLLVHVENKRTAQPLYLAVNNADKPMIKLFLKNGADKDHGEDGHTPFDFMKKYALEDCIKLFDGY